MPFSYSPDSGSLLQDVSLGSAKRELTDEPQ